MALADAAGFSAAEVARVGDLFESLALGLQMYDDAADWEKDLAESGAWAAALLGVTGAPLAEAQRMVRASEILPRMVDRGREHFANAERMARSMKATRIAEWAEERHDALGRAFQEERRSPGYAARQNALTSWALEVLR
jgi:geranylgeranyl pyrophosphate synthase